MSVVNQDFPGAKQGQARPGIKTKGYDCDGGLMIEIKFNSPDGTNGPPLCAEILRHTDGRRRRRRFEG